MVTELAGALLTTATMPVQIEGWLTDGRWFYFRARGEDAHLGASAQGPAAAVAASIPPGPHWATQTPGEFVRVKVPAAGFLTEAEAYDLLREMLAQLPAAEL